MHTEKYMIPATWSDGGSRLEILASSARLLHIISVGWSPGTPQGGVEAGVLDAGMGDETDFVRLGSAARGSILLVRTDPVVAAKHFQDDIGRRRAVIARATSAGSTAILWMSPRPDLLMDREMNSLDGSVDALPQAILAREDAELLSRYLAAGNKVRVRLDLPNRTGGPAEQENVVAEIRGRENPDEFVVLGADLDSWDTGAGAFDGGNAALVIEAARDIRLTGLRPRRSIRFVLFSGSKQGWLGSRAYIAAHHAELDRAVAAVFFEGGTARLTGFSLAGRRDTEAELSEALAPLGWGPMRHTYDAALGSDNLAFLLEGLPTFVAIEEDDNYLRAANTAADTYGKVDLVDLKLNTAAAGLLAFSFAELPKTPGPRLSRPAVETLLHQTGLDVEMKAANLWQQWESGQAARP